MAEPRGSVSARPYQQELLEAALEENTIVNLGTGAGKTYIAVMMIKELSPAIFNYYERSVFLVTTVNLVEQQAGYIELHTRLNVGKYWGSLGVDSWLQGKWDQEIGENQVLVMTMTIFKNLILSGYMKFSQVNLLVFDECHHAVKNHEYVQIMRRYNEFTLREADSMRILGLTASLIPSKCRAGDLEQKIIDLERTLCCRSQTAEDLKEVARYATNPEEIKLLYSSDTRDEDVGKLKNLLEAPVIFLENFSSEKKKSQFYDIVKLNLDDCLHILLNLGIWCAHQFAVSSLMDIIDRIDSCCGCYESVWEESLISLGRTHMQMFVNDSEKILQARGNEIHMVDKVKTLLGDPTICSGESEGTSKLVGIIFTERRTTAASLCSLLRHQSEKVPELRHIKCDYVVGHDAKIKTTYLRKEAKMTSKKQGGVLEKFRKGNINLLVATSVVEEGVDIPRCNTVIRFDFPPNFRSYVQSKGRARAKESRYILLIPREDKIKLYAELINYNSLVKELERVCHNRHINDSYDHLMEEVNPYKNAHGATATINSSLSLVHRYCQTLPKDRYTIPAPDFRTEKIAISGHNCHSHRVSDQEYEYQTILTFPMSAPIKEHIEGEWFPSRKLAKKSAALEAVKKLDESGELDPHLKPKTKADIDSDDEDEEFSGTGDGVRVGEGKKARYYLNQTAPSLVDCFPAAIGNYLYIFYISDSTLGGLYLPLSDAEEQQHSFGILSSKSLPHLQIPEFSVYDDNKELYVKICKYHMTVNLTDSEIKELKEAHCALFKSVLKIRPSWLQCCFEQAEKNYLVVPLCFIPFLEPMEAYIDFDMAKKLSSLKSAQPGEGLMRSEDILPPVTWPVPDPHAMFRNRMIMKKYDQKHTLHEVKEVSSDILLSSRVDFKSTHSTYREYFSEKYDCTFTDNSQPALVCKQLGESEARMQMLTSRYKTHDGADIGKSKSRENRVTHLFPELCNIHPLPTNVWKLAHCVPSILWRVECILAVDPIRNRISADTGIGKFSDSTEVTTCINFKGYKDMGFGSLDSQKLIKHQGGESEMVMTSRDPLELPLRGPNNVLLLQALTPKGASDSIDLERLETLGDSFLKFSTTVFLYGDRLTAHEGKLSMARARRISNHNLYNLARRQGVTNLILSSSFNPRMMWIPPCFRFDDNDSRLTPLPAPTNSAPSIASGCMPRWPKSEQEKLYVYHKLSDKGVADSMEGLIGAYLVSGGILAGLKFMTCMGVKIQANTESLPFEIDMGSCDLEEGEFSSSGSYVSACSDIEIEEGLLTRSSSGSYAEIPRTKKIKIDSNELPIFVRNSAKILTSFFPPFARCQLDMRQEVELNRLLTISFGKDNIRKTLCWKFTDRTLLLQAMTHASYTKNRLTESYQRLEFLGDAVLDYLVTCHIYSTFPKYNPGEITNMRSALVNNFTFAELAVELKLHKALLYNSPFLYKQIELYIKTEKDCENDGAECENLMIDGESNEAGNLMSEHVSSEEDSTEEEIEYLDPPKVLGDILESLAGAIFVDSGMSLEKVWEVFRPLFDKKIKSFKGEIPIGPIHELFQREPDAKVEKENKGAKRVRFTITVLHKGKPLCVAALASTSKAAKTAAAKAILRKIKEDSLSLNS